MAINPDIRDSAYQFFIEEAPELLQIIEASLLTLRQEYSTAKVHDLMRAAHSLKGGAASVELEAIASLAHRLETIVKALYSDTLEIDTELESQFLQAYDCLRLPLIEQIKTGSFDEEHALTIAEPIFAQLEERLGDAFTQSDSYIPSSAELGVDMTRSIFEVDVAQGLERLEAVVTNPTEYEVAGEIRAQAEVFAGFAELLNQPGFEAIAKTTLAALEAHPDRALVIAQLALTDFHIYRQAVLAGTIHTQEFNPSAALIALTSSTATKTSDLSDLKGDAELGSWGVGEIFEQTFSPITEWHVVKGDDGDGGDGEEISSLPSPTSPTSPPSFSSYHSPITNSQPPELIQGEQKTSDWSAAFSPQTIDSIADLELSLEETENPIPSLEDIFGSAWATPDTELNSNILPTSRKAEGVGEAEEVLPLTATGYEVETTEAVQEEQVKSTGWRGEDPSAEEEVFTNISQKNPPPASPASLAPLPLEASETPDSEIIEVQWVAESTVLAEESVAEFPSLEEVFGGAFATFETEDSASSSIVPVTSTSNSLQELHLDKVEYPEAPETLDVAIKSIEQIFDDLPPIQESSTLTSKLKSGGSTANKRPAASKGKASSTNLSVRVDLERLERMNNLVGELAINRNGLSLQNEQLQGSVKELLNRFSKVQNMVGNLRQLSDQMLVGSSSSGLIASNPGFLSVARGQQSEELKVGMLNVGKLNVESPEKNLQPFNLQPSNLEVTTFDGELTNDHSPFDSLELDSYGALHSRLQGLLEEMMQLEESVEDIVLFAKASDQTLEQQRQMVTQLRDELMWARMLPLGEVLNRFPRVLRDLSTTYHKPVSLKLSGTSVLVDKAVLEKLHDPLLHLLRNAFDHGIEFPDSRRQQGKTEEGQIEIRAYHRGSQTIIEVKDDGQGLNTERIGRRAVELGLLSAEQLSVIPHNQLVEFVFEPGFSTASQVSELSGRGVGLDVVRSQLRSLKGTITVTSSPRKGTTFTLRLPLTLSVAKLLVCFVGSSALALPSDSIEEIVIPKSDQIKKSGAQQFLHWRGQIVPTYQLADFLSYACPMPETSPSKALISVPSPKNWALPMLVLRQGQQFFALEIDRLVTEQELVIKPFGDAIAPPSCTYGCTILGDGSLVPVIDAAVLLEQLVEERTVVTPTTTGFNHRQAIANESQEPSAAQENSSISKTSTAITTALGAGLIGTNRTSGTTNKAKPAPTILVVDDAVALRRTLALTLERAGCRVLQARDGREAIERLQQTSSVNLVVCDIEMPNMNGFEFLSQRRLEAEILKIPIVMLTSRSSDKHRWLAMQLGATAYFTKPYLEQDFVAAIKKIISQAESLPAQS